MINALVMTPRIKISVKGMSFNPCFFATSAEAVRLLQKLNASPFKDTWKNVGDGLEEFIAKPDHGKLIEVNFNIYSQLMEWHMIA